PARRLPCTLLVIVQQSDLSFPLCNIYRSTLPVLAEGRANRKTGGVLWLVCRAFYFYRRSFAFISLGSLSFLHLFCFSDLCLEPAFPGTTTLDECTKVMTG